jgi:hypothetical protein
VSRVVENIIFVEGEVGGGIVFQTLIYVDPWFIVYV